MNPTMMFRTLAGACYCFSMVAAAAAAEPSYPRRPIQIVVPFAAGGSIDSTMRWIGPGLAEQLGQPIVIVNRPGGGATIGMNVVARANPDGYTLGAASFAFAANPFVLGSDMPFDSVKDFEPVTMVARQPLLMVVNPVLGVKSVQEFINYAKARPGQLNYGSVGIASSGHLITALFEQLAGLKMVHVPITPLPLPSLVSNQIQLQFAPVPVAMPFTKVGRLLALGVTTLKPDPLLPGIPPVADTVPGFESYEWPGLVVKSGTPRAIINQLQKAVATVIAKPEVKALLESVSAQPVGSTPAEFRAFIKKEMTTWEKVARQVSASDAAGGR